MGSACRSFLVRLLHTLTHLVMVAAIASRLHAGITGSSGVWLWTSLGLLAVESIVFVAHGLKCPLTALAIRYGAGKGRAFGTLIPERFTRCTLPLFGTLMVAGRVLLTLRWTGAVD
ncbi:MAG: hypothetical protein AB1778_03550 [Candidatus Bipolaricaulota bacterium]